MNLGANLGRYPRGGTYKYFPAIRCTASAEAMIGVKAFDNDYSSLHWSSVLMGPRKGGLVFSTSNLVHSKCREEGEQVGKWFTNLSELLEKASSVLVPWYSR